MKSIFVSTCLLLLAVSSFAMDTHWRIKPITRHEMIREGETKTFAYRVENMPSLTPVVNTSVRFGLREFFPVSPNRDVQRFFVGLPVNSAQYGHTDSNGEVSFTLTVKDVIPELNRFWVDAVADHKNGNTNYKVTKLLTVIKRDEPYQDPLPDTGPGETCDYPQKLDSRLRCNSNNIRR